MEFYAVNDSNEPIDLKTFICTNEKVWEAGFSSACVVADAVSATCSPFLNGSTHAVSLFCFSVLRFCFMLFLCSVCFPPAVVAEAILVPVTSAVPDDDWFPARFPAAAAATVAPPIPSASVTTTTATAEAYVMGKCRFIFD